MYFVEKWQHMSYTEKKELASHIANFGTFCSTVISNPRNGDTSIRGSQRAHANLFEQCEKCNRYNRYTVWSYETRMYSFCSNCHDEYIDVTNYSNMTKILQEVLCEAFDSYNERYQEYHDKIRQARKYLTPERKRVLGITKKLTDEKALEYYERAKKEQKLFDVVREIARNA